MIGALPRVIAQLGDRRLVAVFAKSIVLTLALLVALWFVLDRAIGGIDPAAFPEFMRRTWTGAGDWAALPLAVFGGWFLFPGIATGVMSLFLDEVVDAVEDRHYPNAAALRKVGIGEAALLGVASAARVLLWNLALAPLYIVLLFTAIGPALLFVAVNGWVMGRDLLEMVAVRHMPRAEARDFIAANRGVRLRLGMTAAPLYIVPVVNLFAPIVSAALAAHAFQAARKLG